jgi:phosphatidylglycerol lysyltransferase
MSLPVHLTTAGVMQKLKPFLALILFGGALWVLDDALSEFHYQHILQQLEAIPASRIATAFGLTVLSYLLLTAYDRLAIEYVQHPLETGKVALASFVSYAFSNNIGLSLLASSSIRYRLYSVWGFSAEEIARLVAFTALTFWLGIITLGAVLFTVEPLALPTSTWLPFLSARTVGLLFAGSVIGYLFLAVFRKTPFHLFNWEIKLPRQRLAWAQLLVGSLDWMLAGSVLYALLPETAPLSFPQFLGIYLLSQIVALISHVPGGLGVFESMILLTVPDIPADTLLGVLLTYRGIYYLIPLVLATLLLGGNELLQKRSQVSKAARIVGRWGGAMVPQLLAATTFVGGAILLFSGATPAVPERLAWLKDLLPLPIIEISHFLGSLAGVCLLLLARGLQRRFDAAYLLTALLLAVGSLLSMLKGADYEEALFLALMLAALFPCRRHFYRRASLFSEPFSLGWTVTILLVMVSSVWLGFFAFKHVDYSNELWWEFTLAGDAPRFLRAAVGSAALVLFLTVAKLLRPVPADPELPNAEDLESARAIIGRVPGTAANLALLGDKALLFDDTRSGFVMYGVAGRSWIAMGDPVGPSAVIRDLAWKFRELVERHGGQTIFYEVGTASLHIYLDMGLTLLKLGEEAVVPLAKFSLEGQQHKGLRYSYHRLGKEGCSFEVVSAREGVALLPELKTISAAWLKHKNSREKGFSLGFFNEHYLANFPVAVVRQHGEMVAFANIWAGADKEELSVDLMRYLPEAPRGVMDFLFVSLMLWGKEQGYQRFALGMAPLAGMENRPFSPLWNRLGAVIFRHGEHFYNFEGLREYKDKFDPLWEPRYLACPGGITLPWTLVNVTTLIGGGIKGVVAK